MGRRGSFAVGILAIAALVQPARAAEDDATPFGSALVAAERSLADGKNDEAKRQVDRALERDAKSVRAWDLRARWAEAAGEKDEAIYALHRRLALLVAQKAPKAEVSTARQRLEALDPNAKALLDLDKAFLERLLALAKEYEKGKRPHSAIRAYGEALALSPDRTDIAEAIQRVSSAPDPSLAETAKAKDLLADVSEEWIRKQDVQHATWEKRAILERENYVTHSNAGYAVLVRAAEAMEQMNAFYRQFFHYGTEKDGKQVPRIALHIFKTRDEYLSLGKHPVKWSGGQFTGDSVETYTGDGSFEGMTGTLFHEAAHQFVSLATTASGWLNEGLACFFEGCRILPNGTVQVNRPAAGRLFELVDRMQAGWMTSAADGIDKADPSVSRPSKAPTFRIVLENEYEWGPPWYAPTWGVVYFLYDYQEPSDGRFVYRNAFRTFINTSGGRVGKGAIKNFEEVVLANPQPPTKGVPEAKANRRNLPKAVDQLDPLWKEWMIELRDESNGTIKPDKPYLAWARHAITRKDYDDATEHFEKGLERNPLDVDLLVEFADHLADRSHNADRASKLVTMALAVVEASKEPDAKRIAALEALLEKYDPKRATLDRLHKELWGAAKTVAEKYEAAKQPLMTMHATRKLGGELGVPGLDTIFEVAVRSSGKTLALWQLAYDEKSLAGWAPDTAAAKVFQPYGTLLRAKYGEFKAESYAATFLTYDTLTSGDFSFESEVHAEKGKSTICGLVFGRKSAAAFHALAFFPEGYADLVSFYGSGGSKTWRHNPVPAGGDPWHRLRVDVAGSTVDVWFDGQYVASQDLGDEDVLRGSLGLFTGVGETEFRNVRFLSRPRHDVGAQIERKVRLEALQSTGKPVGGSYVGLVPPFPAVRAWVQGKREGWAEKGFVPTLLVFWSRRQNDAIPLEGWLQEVAKNHAATGLEIVAISEEDDADKLKQYLTAHPYPGAVASDLVDLKKGGQGEWFDAFFVGSKFLLPRLLLLDIDRKVVWEGSPGFDTGHAWKPGEGSYLDTPLEELEKKRGLSILCPWLKSWPGADAEAAFAAGDLSKLGKLLGDARGLPGDLVPEVARAQSLLRPLDAALATFDKSADALMTLGADPAVAALATWGAAVGKPVDPAKVKGIKKAASSSVSAAWSLALQAAARAAKDAAAAPDPVPVLDAAATKLSGMNGKFPRLLGERVRAALDAKDTAAARRALEEAAKLPGAFLASWLRPS